MTDVAPEVLARLSRRSRVVAAVLGAVGFLYAVLVPLLSGRPALFLALLIVLPVGYAVIFRRRRRPGFAFGHYDGQPAFAAPLTPSIGGALVIVLLEAAGLLVPAGGGGLILPGAAAALPVAALLVASAVAVLLVAAAVAVLRTPPLLRLTAEGLVVTGRPNRLIPWDAFAPCGPAGPEMGRDAIWLQARAGTRGLGREWATDVRGRPPAPGQAWFRLRLRAVLVDPEFLARSLRTYRSNPRLRPAIGTAEGVDDLFGFATSAV
ncbi:hypothetical protein [Cryptosporangium phraense]|uniref:PH domain-containing protein n=1 Tax=Cryptosporangium phraense TaxID=2593070 RepID=A0A545AXH9_9ACTN|nr:hypothetical protein [Cryptosporangium phraense]TQS46039.1 hypothetical protein FL583_06000 [Cryptosporangium phraense]